MPKLAELVKNSMGVLRGLGAGIADPVRKILENIRRRIPTRLRLPALALLCVLMVFILGLLIAALVQAPQRKGGRGAELSAAFSPPDIPPEDFFLPAEPDFLPDFLPERKKRDSWTAEDARPYWTDPLEQGAGRWLNGINSVVDELLERVP